MGEKDLVHDVFGNVEDGFMSCSSPDDYDVVEGYKHTRGLVINNGGKENE